MTPNQGAVELGSSGAISGNIGKYPYEVRLVIRHAGGREVSDGFVACHINAGVSESPNTRACS